MTDINTTNFRDTDTQNLIRLHTLGLIDDKAFTEAIKKLHLKANSQPAIEPCNDHMSKAITRPYNPISPLHPTTDVPFREDSSSGKSDLVKRWVSTGSPYTATLTSEQSSVSGLYKPDPYSGSILKPEQPFITGSLKPEPKLIAKYSELPTEYHDCKQSPCQHKWDGYRWIDCSPTRDSRLTEVDWDYAMTNLLTKQDKEAVKKSRVDVVPYSENRSHLPDHAQMVLNWIDDAWKEKVDEYNATKPDWQRVQYTDDEGNEVVEWIEKIQAEKELEAYKKFAEENVVVEGDDVQLNGLQHIFHLTIGKDEC